MCINSTAQSFAIHNGTGSDWFIDGAAAASRGAITDNTPLPGTGFINSSMSFLVTSAKTVTVEFVSRFSPSVSTTLSSDPVTIILTVQGLYDSKLLCCITYYFLVGPPSPPSELTATPLNESSIKLTWSVPPGVLDEELISYLVEVRNESGGLIVLCETDGTEYTFSMDNPDPCDLYSFTVTTLCDTVEGETSVNIDETVLAGKQDQHFIIH